MDLTNLDNGRVHIILSGLKVSSGITIIKSEPLLKEMELSISDEKG